MDAKRLGTIIVGRFLAPALTYVILERLTEYVVVAIGGAVGLVTLAFFMPSLATGIASLDAGFERLRATKRSRLITGWCERLNAYKAVLTKYPPELLPRDWAEPLMSQHDILIRFLRQHRGGKTRQFPTTYDFVRDLRLRSEDFDGLTMDACDVVFNDLIDDLSQIPQNPFQRVLQGMEPTAEPQISTYHLETVENHLDQVFRQALTTSPLVEHIRTHTELRQRVMTLLRTGDVHRQSSVQTYLLAHLPDWPPHEVDDLVKHMRYDVVVDALGALFESDAVEALVPDDAGAGRNQCG